MENHAKARANVRVISTVLDPSGKEVGKAASAPVAIPSSGERTYEQQVGVKQPALWSLEERNLYTLVTEVESGGADHRSLRDPLRHPHPAVRPRAAASS